MGGEKGGGHELFGSLFISSDREEENSYAQLALSSGGEPNLGGGGFVGGGREGCYAGGSAAQQPRSRSRKRGRGDPDPAEITYSSTSSSIRRIK